MFVDVLYYLRITYVIIELNLQTKNKLQSVKVVNTSRLLIHKNIKSQCQKMRSRMILNEFICGIVVIIF